MNAQQNNGESSGLSLTTPEPRVVVSTGNYDVVGSGILNLSSTDFSVQVDDLTIKFTISKINGKDDKPGYNASTEGDKCLNINIKAGATPFSQGVYPPIEIGTLRGRRLYINFTLSNISTANDFCVAVYNVLQGEKVNG